MSIGSAGSVLSIGSILSGLSSWSVRAWRSRGEFSVPATAGLHRSAGK
jgi:hypothetical protein